MSVYLLSRILENYQVQEPFAKYLPNARAGHKIELCILGKGIVSTRCLNCIIFVLCTDRITP